MYGGTNLGVKIGCFWVNIALMQPDSTIANLNWEVPKNVNHSAHQSCDA